MSTLRHQVYVVIFEADTRAGKAFDVGLMIAIVVSVLTLMLETVAEISDAYGPTLKIVEWVLTGLFTVEYGLRILSAKNPRHYALSFFGVVDLMSLLPTYLSLVVSGTHVLTVVRALRLLRIFRVLKLARFVGEAQTLASAMRASLRKITIFIGTVVMMVLILGTLMYLVEGGGSGGFSSIPKSIYWAIVTMTTVGYGDIVPVTTAGKLLASVVMILGYGVIAVPTGIVSMELAASERRSAYPGVTTRTCHACIAEGHDMDAAFCKYCGERLS
jgi:voltage-gated potassium channel